MFSRVAVVLIMVLVSGCGNSSSSLREMGVVCFDGVKYYKEYHVYRGYMAVKINKDTLQPERCEDDKDR